MSKHCEEQLTTLVAYTLGEADPHVARKLEGHVKDCLGCQEKLEELRREEADIQEAFRSLSSRVESVQTSTTISRGRATVSLFARGIKMVTKHRTLSIASAASLMFIAGFLGYALTIGTTKEAYAIDYTTRANEAITSYRVRISPVKNLAEAWIEFGPGQTLQRARLEFRGSKNEKTTVISDDKASVWLKKRNVLLLTEASSVVGELETGRHLFDPKVAFDRLQKLEASGNASIVAKSIPELDVIRLEVTFEEAPDQKQVYEVDSPTKLVKRIRTFGKMDGEWKQESMREFLDYNVPIDSAVFTLDVPDDVVTVDQVNRAVGVPKTNLSDSQAAKELAIEFVEAIIAKNYRQAGVICGGLPADKLKQRFTGAGIEYVRLLSIEEPRAAQQGNALIVLLRVEAIVRGEKVTVDIKPHIKPVEANAGRYYISGGI
ncbi:MAG TPA: hypothetical protein DDW52_21855 [Planctomycetaceae bacterium]|nr:hypothetical protein [Planctomycetaceae bacterium]